MEVNQTTPRAGVAVADPEPRPLSEIVAAALAASCTIPGCTVPHGTACDSGNAVHLARISAACRAGIITGREFVAVIITATNSAFRPFTLIRPEETR
jgi:hypothetical protein